jgi:SAM-dependent methyltransferase
MTSQPTLADWCHRCSSCGTWGATLPVAINDEDSPIDEAMREVGLRSIRQRVSGLILRRIEAGEPPGRRLLDVGSAHGWFVGAAADSGYEAEGLEPDEGVAADAVARTRVGYFPEALDSDERFDVLTFNDVLEHIPDPRSVVSACHQHLSSGGLLSINIPSSAGIVFRSAVVARRRGRGQGLFDRLWQVGLPSPHLWFFDRAALVRLCDEEGFDVVQAGILPTMTWRGFWSRAHMDRRPSPVTVAGVAAGVVSAPLLNRGGDIMHLVLRKRP